MLNHPDTRSPASILDIPRREPLIGLPVLARILRVIAHLCGMIFCVSVVSGISVVCVGIALESPSGSVEAATGRDVTQGFTNVLDWLSNATLISGGAFLVLTLAGSIVTEKINTSSYTAVAWPPAANTDLPLKVVTEGHYAELYEDLVDHAANSGHDSEDLIRKLSRSDLRNILKFLVDADVRKMLDAIKGESQ